jgi:hypothetical protein
VTGDALNDAGRAGDLVGRALVNALAPVLRDPANSGSVIPAIRDEQQFSFEG